MSKNTLTVYTYLHTGPHVTAATPTESYEEVLGINSVYLKIRGRASKSVNYKKKIKNNMSVGSTATFWTLKGVKLMYYRFKC